MADYSSMKVPELKKLLGERSLTTSGNKSDLIARLEENDKKPATSSEAPAAGNAEDEIDWDEEEPKVTSEPAAAAIAAGGQGQVANPAAVPNQVPAVDPSTTSDLKATDATTATETAEEAPQEPKVDFTIGIAQTDAEKEATKRAERAKRFGIVPAEEDKKKEERAKKFGTEAASAVVKGLDDALPERRAKRGREISEKPAGRDAKRQTPDRRTEGPKVTKIGAKPAPAKKAGSILDDPVEKAKAEARAKKFGTAV